MEIDLSKRKDSTDTLLDGIFKASALDDFVKKHEDALQLPTLPEYLSALCREKRMIRAEVVRRAGIDRSFGFQIFQGVKNPSRDKIIQLAVGFGLGYEEAQALIKTAQKSALYPRIKRDAAIIYCLDRHLSFTDTQAVLSGMDIAVLGKDRDS